MRKFFVAVAVVHFGAAVKRVMAVVVEVGIAVRTLLATTVVASLGSPDDVLFPTADGLPLPGAS